MTKTLVTGLLGVLVTGLAFGGWHVRSYLAENVASKQEVLLVGAQVDFLLDQQIESLVAQISYLEKKRNKSQEELNQLNYLRKRLDTMRKVQKGK